MRLRPSFVISVYWLFHPRWRKSLRLATAPVLLHFFTPCSEHEDLASIIHRENSGGNEQQQSQNHLISPGAHTAQENNTMPIQAEQTGIPGPLSSQYENFGGLEFSRDDDAGFFVEHIYSQVRNPVRNINLSKKKSFYFFLFFFWKFLHFYKDYRRADQLHNTPTQYSSPHEDAKSISPGVNTVSSVFKICFNFSHSIFLHNLSRSNRSSSSLLTTVSTQHRRSPLLLPQAAWAACFLFLPCRRFLLPQNQTLFNPDSVPPPGSLTNKDTTVTLPCLPPPPSQARTASKRLLTKQVSTDRRRSTTATTLLLDMTSETFSTSTITTELQTTAPLTSEWSCTHKLWASRLWAWCRWSTAARSRDLTTRDFAQSAATLLPVSITAFARARAARASSRYETTGFFIFKQISENGAEKRQVRVSREQKLPDW